MTETSDEPNQTSGTQDQDTAPASEPAGAAAHEPPAEDQDAGPASEPGGAAESPAS